MNKDHFINLYREAFGGYELPIGFWYSDQPAGVPEKTKHCFITDLKKARNGNMVSLNADTISCSGGRVYTGFSAMLPHIPGFVSTKECYKQSPELVEEFIDNLEMPDQSSRFINFVSIDQVESLDQCEGLIFFATPDVLTGLMSWAFYDNNRVDAVCAPFGSACSSMVAQTCVENQNDGYRCFIGLFDPSVRPRVEENVLSFAIPMSRFKVMYHTFEQSCLKGTHAWQKVKERIEANNRNIYTEKEAVNTEREIY